MKLRYVDMMLIRYVVVLFLLMTGCRKDSGERIFEMLFPNITFEIPAGLNASFQQVFELPVVPSNIDAYLTEFSMDTAMIRAILPVSARLSSLDGAPFGYDFVEAISIRICDPAKADCFDGEEVFYIDNLRGRAGQEIRLIPGLRNAKRDLIRQQFRLEVVFYFAYTTPFAVRSRLQLSFEALR
jgi:hypothetical protein